MALADIAAGRTRLRVPMVRPPRAVTRVPIADLRARPTADSELVDRSHYGERLTNLGERDAWLWVQGEDHYFGWIARDDVSDLVERGTEIIVAVLRAEIRDEPEASSPPVALLPVGSVLMRWRHEDGWVQTELGWLRGADVVEPTALPNRPATPEDLIATARVFLGTPYLWGGTSGDGIDCSGFVQQVYRLNGVGLDRDADQQALEGRSVDAPVAGDLLFFGSPGVTHVALSLGGDDFIHAPMRGGAVEERKIGPDRTPVSIRRYLLEGLYSAEGAHR